MWKSKLLLNRRVGCKLNCVFVVTGLLFTFVATSCLFAQDPLCRIRCGTQQVPCAQAEPSLCGVFRGSVEIIIQDPRTPDRLLTITTIDLALVLDDNGPGNSDWRGYVSPAQSLVFPIINPADPPESQRGPDVSGSHQGRQCSEESPCILTSSSFTTPVSGAAVQRQFVLAVTQIIYQGETASQTPRTLVGQYWEIIQNYAVGRDIQVSGTFRLERAVPIVRLPKG